MFYKKFYKSCYEELINYYPRYYRDVLEMCAILKADGNIADKLEDSIEKVFANAFIDTADAATVARLERFLDLKLKKVGTLEERRRIVKAFFVGSGKTSASMLKSMISAYTNSEVTVRFEPADTYGNNKLYIEFDRGSEKDVFLDDIQTLVSMKIPAHIEFSLNMTYGTEITAIHAAAVQEGTITTYEMEAV